MKNCFVMKIIAIDAIETFYNSLQCTVQNFATQLSL